MNLAQYAVETRARPADFQRKLREDHGIDLDHETIRKWFKGDLQPGARLDLMEAIEAATDGRVTRHDQRPDVYGPPPKTKRRAA